ncbi:MAG: RNA polymerase sigma-54 factor [Candidatus Endobugula sp.]|jgi:RNA polymerase sigma-54 factor
MKQSLQLKMGQSLTMTPQLQQAIRLLQLSTLDLQNEIQEALDTNPMLEVAEDLSKTDNKETNANSQAEMPASKDPTAASNTDDNAPKNSDTNAEATEELEWSQTIPEDLPVDTSWDDVYQSSSVGPSSSATGSDDDGFETQRSGTESLQDHLMWQLNLTHFSDKDHSIALTIIDDIKPCGMLSSSINDIFTALTDSLDDIDEDEVFAVLHRLQQFDPPGVASQNLGECLLIQLQQLEQKNQSIKDINSEIAGVECAKKIVSEHLALLASRDYKTLMRKLRIKENELKQAIILIQSMNPHPGEDIGSDNTEYVIPDVFVSKKNDRWVVELNPDIAPKIRINNQYAGLVKRADSSSDNTYLKDNLQEARWFIKSLQSRNETLLKVSTAIVEKQRGFLDFGEEAMKPLVLHDIAEAVEMHESTISRVTTNKYMHTPKGIFELKYFFSSHVSTDSGGECSSTAIRAIIKKLISAENVAKPLSDSKITNLLGEQGIKVARRTIAKYRESMSIPPSNERKQLI